MFTTPGVPLKDDSPGGLKTQNASVDSEPMLLYARLRGHVSASGPVRLPSSASAMSLSTGAGDPIERTSEQSPVRHYPAPAWSKARLGGETRQCETARQGFGSLLFEPGVPPVDI